MDVQRLRVLCALAERGSVTAVAHALSFTPSAVSQQLRALEREAGVVLVERVGRGVRLTDAGQRLVADGHHVLAALERAEAGLDEHRRGAVPTVRVAAFPSFARLLMPGLLSAAHGAGVSARLSTVEFAPATAVRALADHDVLVLHRDERSAPFDGPGVEVEPLVREPVDVVLPQDHPLASQASIEWSQLADETFVGVDVGLPIDDLMSSLGTTTGIRPRIGQRINDFPVTQAVVAAGHGVALLPRYVVDPREPLALRPLAGVRVARQIDLVVRAGSSGRRPVRWALDALHGLVATLPSG
jgi:DNA-binding transcriptional LysR family regulator